MSGPTFDPTDLIARLGVEAIPQEGTWFRPGPRVAGLSSIVALFADTPDGFSAMHRLAIDEGWQWMEGAPIEMLLLGPDGEAEVARLDAEHPQVLIPRGWWQGGRTLGDWTVIACWCSPAFEYEHFELGDRAELVGRYPEHADRITALTRDGRS